MTWWIEGQAVDLSTSASVSLRDLLCQRQAAFRFASYTEATASGFTRSVLVSRLWERTRALVEELIRRPHDADQPLLLCFETTQELLVGAWASILLERDAYLWQVLPEGVAAENLLRRAERVRSSLGSGVLVTHPRLAEQSWLAPFHGDSPAVFPIQLPSSRTGNWIPEATNRKARFLLETSGTTGDPKIGVLTHQALVERRLMFPAPDPNSTRASMLSFDSITGLKVLLPTWNRTLLMHPLRFTREPAAYLQMAKDYRANTLVFSTTFAQHLLDRIDPAEWKGMLDGLVCAGFGLEQVVPGVVWKLMDHLDAFAGHRVKLGIGYGMTETGLLTSTTLELPEKLLPPREVAAPVSVGSCMPGRRIRIRDDAGNAVREGESGRVEVQTDYGRLAGYIHADGTTSELNLTDGWLQTGDLGFISQQTLTVVGRKKAVFISGGRNIPLASIDLALLNKVGHHCDHVAAVTVTDAERNTDQLVIVYASDLPPGFSKKEMASSCMDAVTQVAPVPVFRVLRVSTTDFSFTTSGKLRRGALASCVESRLQKEQGTEISTDHESFKVEAENDPVMEGLVHIWKECLPAGMQVTPETHFFRAGGDSLKATAMVDMAEMRFHKRIPLGHFFQNPRLHSLARFIRESHWVDRDVGLAEHQLALRRQREVLEAWSGEELFSGSLMRIYHRRGRQRPFFLVCQYPKEAEALADTLGPDFPIYAFHSWHQIIDVPDLETPLADSLADRMLWEVLAACPDGSLVLGGICQAGLPALTMARKLVQLGRVPHALLFVEWMFPSRAYAHPVHLIYGSHSPAAGAYEDKGRGGAGWAELFPQATTQHLPVDHGNLFEPGNVEHLADRYRPFLEKQAARRPKLFPRPVFRKR